MHKQHQYWAYWIIVLCTVALSQTRISRIGSNPYFSWELFPQDIASWQGSFITFNPQYQQSPWWGDIDEPANKPRATYTTTGTLVSTPRAFFKESATMHTSSNLFGYAYRPNLNLMSTFDVDYTIQGLRDRASGNFSNKDTLGTLIGHVPFDYSLSHTLNSLTVRGALAFTAFGIPAGVKLDAGFDNTLELDSKLTFSKQDTVDSTVDTTYSSDRALWGWTTSPCAHIFDARGVEGDAWLQNGYAIGPLYRGEFRLGFTLPKVKAGALVRYRAGLQDQYSWEQDTSIHTGDTIIDQNFMGSYHKNDWTKKSRDGAVNLYGNIRWIDGERFTVNTFAVLGYHGGEQGSALGTNRAVERTSKESQRGFDIEFMPNIAINLDTVFHFINAGIDLKYTYTRHNNRYERGVGGGMIETYFDATVNNHDEDVWENFSYANQNTMDAGIDLSTMFPLRNENNGLLSLGLNLQGASRFDFKTKYYGVNSNNGAQNLFTVNNRRKNFTREVFFNTALSLNYMRSPYYIRLAVEEPVLHSRLFQTEITDAGDTRVVYRHRKEPLWLSLQGLRVSCFVSYEMRLPFLTYE